MVGYVSDIMEDIELGETTILHFIKGERSVSENGLEISVPLK